MMRRACLIAVLAAPSSAVQHSVRTQYSGATTQRHKRKWKYDPITAGFKPKNYTALMDAEYKAELDEYLRAPVDEKGVPKPLPNNGYWDVPHKGMRRRVTVHRRNLDVETYQNNMSHLELHNGRQH
jgi:hypothetical protein